MSTNIKSDLKFLENLSVTYISNKSYLKTTPNLALVQFTLPTRLLPQDIPKIVLFAYLLINFHIN